MKKLFLPLAIVLVMALTVQFPRYMISPGKLNPAHTQLDQQCLACHAPFGGVTNANCMSCHQPASIGLDSLPALGVAQARSTLFHQGLGAQACTSCHLEHIGDASDASSMHFQHGLLAPTALSNCVNCHQQPDNALHGQVSSSCKSCHSPAGWAVSGTFDHEMIVGTDKADCATCHNKPDDAMHLPLLAQCSSCHATSTWDSDITFDHNLIQGTDAANCVACHKKPVDGFHLNFPENCSQCHNNAQWVPSTFDHRAFFVLDRAHTTQCKTCHTTSDFAVYTCMGCHEHSEGNLAAEHNEKGITNIQDCARCHQSGNEDDIKRMEGTEGKLKPGEANRVREYIQGHGENGSDDED